MLAIGRHILAIHVVTSFPHAMALPWPLAFFATGIGTEDPMTPIGVGWQVSLMPEAWDSLEESGFFSKVGRCFFG